MSLTGTTPQAGRFAAENTFRDGLNADAAPEATTNTIYTSSGNIHLLEQKGSDIIVRSEKGTLKRARLPDNFVVMGWASRDSILYLALAHVVNGVASGRGQVGTFPSPAQGANGTMPVASGALVNEYSPLYVYQTDPTSPTVSALDSPDFKFSLDKPLELNLQPSYDGSVNILLHDRGNTPALLINSGFKRTGAMSYKLLERTGQIQTNRYSPADFAGRLRQQLRGQTAARINLKSVTDGGSLPGGEYRYYLLYVDADGNQTGVACELGPVFVFDGNTPALSQGALPGKNTQRRVTLAADRLDPQLGYAQLAWVHRSGEPAATSVAQRLRERYPIPKSGYIEITHNGQQETAVLDSALLLPLSSRVDRFVTSAAAEQGRLLVAGIEMSSANIDVLTEFRNFAKTCVLGYGYSEMREPGVKPSVSGNTVEGIYTSVQQNQTDLDAFDSGHANPMNLTYRLGYHDGEAYAFVLQALLTDGSITEGFGVRGTDLIDPVDPIVYQDNNFDEQGWAFGFISNISGVMRFPLRNRGFDQKQNISTTTQGAVNVLHGLLKIADVPLALRENVKAIRLLRAPRRPNRILQGYIVPTLKSLASPPGGDQPYDHHHPDIKTILQGLTTENLKVLPAPDMAIEMGIRNINVKGDNNVGAYPFQFYRVTNAPGASNVSLKDPKRWAMYAPEIAALSSELRQQFSGSGVKMEIKAVVRTRRMIDHPNDANTRSFTLLQTIDQQNAGNGGVYTGRGFWTDDNQALPNLGRFGSHETFLLGKDSFNNKFRIQAAYEEYIGLELDNVADQTHILTPVSSGAQTGYEFYSPSFAMTTRDTRSTAYLVDVYNGTGVWDGQTLRSAYSAESTTYQPITNWMEWDELESTISNERQLTFFGGDCFLAQSYRRFMRAPGAEQLPSGQVIPSLGQVLGMVTSSSVNPWTRSPDEINSFTPRLGADAGNNFKKIREAPYRNRRETSRYNGGYIPADRNAGALITYTRDLTGATPFSRFSFRQRVWSTQDSSDSAFSNGWRNFPPLLFRDYDIGAGEIMRIVAGPDGKVLLVYERGLATIQLNERAAFGDAELPVYMQSKDLLPEKAQPIATDLGLQHAFAITQTDLGVYGLDAMQNVVWQYLWGASKAERISDYRTSSLLKPMTQLLSGKPVKLLDQDIRLCYDDKRGDVIVSAYQFDPLFKTTSGGKVIGINGGGLSLGSGTVVAFNGYLGPGNLTLLYNENMSKWISPSTLQAQMIMPLNERFPLAVALPGVGTDSPAQRWLYETNQVAPTNGLLFFGRKQSVWIEFVVLASGPETIKNLDNLVIISNDEVPVKMTITAAEQGTFSQTFVYNAGVVASTIKRDEQKTYAQINAPKEKPWGNRVRAQWIKVRLEFPSNKQLRLSQIFSLLRESVI